jgi:hypothetical protein
MLTVLEATGVMYMVNYQQEIFLWIFGEDAALARTLADLAFGTHHCFCVLILLLSFFMSDSYIHNE